MYAKDANTLVKSENGEELYFHDTNGIPRTRKEMDWSIVNGYIIPAFRGSTTHEVEKLLDYVDLKLDWYIPSVEAFEVINFIRFSLGKEPENLNSKAHYFFIDCMLTSSEVKPYFDVRNLDYNSRLNDTLILSTREFSKALTAETLIATPDGDRQIIDIEDGDYVYSRTGKKTKVLKKSEMFFDTTYKMVLADGREIRCSRDHEHILWRRKAKYIGYFDENGKKVKKGEGKLYRIFGMEEVVMTSEELERDGVTRYRKKTDNHMAGFEHKYYIPRMDNPIDYPECDSPIDPYTVGVILGDGSVSLGSKLVDSTRSEKTRGATRITTHVDDVESMLKHIPYKVDVYGKSDSNARTLVLDKALNKTISEFIGVDRSYTKKIPPLLMNGSAKQRLELLKGLMDTDGTINKKGSRSFTSVSKELAENVRDLVFSLGGSARISERKTKSNFGIAYSVRIKINISVFKLQRKIDRETYITARDCFPIESFDVMQSVPSYCLAVECPTKSFLLSNGLVTHNSVLVTFFILYIAWKGKRKNFPRPIKLGLYVSDNMKGNVAQTMDTIKNLVIKSEYLSGQFEYTKFNKDHIVLIRHPRTKKHINAFVRAMKDGKKLEEVKYRDERTFTLKGIGASGGRGPASLDSILYTDKGKVTMKDIAVGDMVFTPNGKTAKVISKSKVFNNRMFELRYKDGRTLKVNETHINVIWSREKRWHRFKKENIVTLDLVDKLKKTKVFTFVNEPVEYSEKDLPLDPYLLGVILGDGNTELNKSPRVKGIDFHVEHYAEKVGGNISLNYSHEKSGTRMCKATFHDAMEPMKKLGLSGVTGVDKFIPEIYLRGSISQRRELLAGLLDTDGTCSIDGRYNSSATSFSNISKNIADGVADIVRSLGGKATVSFRDRSGNRKRLYSVIISMGVNPFTLEYKKKSWVRPSDERWKRTELVSIAEIEKEPSQCVTLNSSKHEYLTDGYLTTHNSRDADLGRPDFAVFDDLVANEEDAYSDTKLKTIESTIEGDVASSLHAGDSFRIFIGTAYHTMDPIYRRVTDGSILPIVFPRAEVAPHGDIYNDHGKLIKPALKKEEFISVWPDRMPFEAQRRDYMKAEISYESGNVKKLASLNQEFYIRVISSTERLIQTDNMKFVSIHDMKVHSELYSWFVTTDFTTSNKKGSDLSVAMLWARDAWGIDTLINISLGHKTIEEQYDDVFKLVDEGTSYGARYVEIGIEVDGPQQIHLYSIKKRAEETKRFIDIAKQINPQKDYKPMSHDGIKSKHIGDKLDRLRLRANDVDMGKVNINKNIPRYQIEEWTELETEFRLATREDIKSRYDDALDCFSQPVLIYVDLPSKELSAKILGKDDDVPQKTLMQLIMDGDLEHIDSGSNDYSILDY